MNRIGIGDFHGADDSGNIQVTLAGGVGSDADCFVGQQHMFQVDVGLGVGGHGFNAEFLASAQNAQCNFAPIGNKHFFQHC